jgi:hypothetical protein
MLIKLLYPQLDIFFVFPTIRIFSAGKYVDMCLLGSSAERYEVY